MTRVRAWLMLGLVALAVGACSSSQSVSGGGGSNGQKSVRGTVLSLPF